VLFLCDTSNALSLFYSILFYSILFYSILFYSILFYSNDISTLTFCSPLIATRRIDWRLFGNSASVCILRLLKVLRILSSLYSLVRYIIFAYKELVRYIYVYKIFCHREHIFVVLMSAVKACKVYCGCGVHMVFCCDSEFITCILGSTGCHYWH